MPTVTVEGPIIPSIDTKRELVRRLTDLVAGIYGIPHIVVLIKENRPENVGVNGVLVCDKEGGGAPARPGAAGAGPPA